ncbi:phosphotransferase family protein [Streptomyces sp. NPDC004749]
MTRGARGARTVVPFGDELRDLLGEPRRARELASSPRSRVWRVDLPDHGPAVVKQLVGGNGAAGRYAREVAALRLAGDAAPQVVPRLLGTEDRARLLVLERLEHGRPAEGWQVRYAAALARLHAAGQAAPRTRSSATPVTAATAAASADPASEASVTDNLLPEEPVTEDLMTGASADEGALPRWAAPTGTDIDSFLTLADILGASPVPSVRDELDALVQRLARPPARPALLHGDPCPGNDLHTPDGIRFIDFEQASIGRGVTELAYLRIGFPTCWCVTAAPEPLLTAAEDAYRSAWHEATGEAAPDTTTSDLVDACAGWLIRGDALVQRAHRGTADRLARLAHRDWTWGTATARQRLLHRLRVVAEAVEDKDGDDTSLDGLGRLCGQMADRMTSRWPRLGPVPALRPDDSA